MVADSLFRSGTSLTNSSLAKRIIRETWKPTVVAGCGLGLHLLGIVGAIPREDALLVGLTSWFETYGIWAIVPVALLENIAPINIYFPGSIVILAGMAITKGNPWLAFATFIAITVPSQIGQIINYRVGKLKATQDGCSPISLLEFILAFWHPQTASIASLRCGNAGWSTKVYLCRLVVVATCWHVFWAIIMYNAGGTAKSLVWLVWLFYGYLAVWIIQGFRAALKGGNHD